MFSRFRKIKYQTSFNISIPCIGKVKFDRPHDSEASISPKMKAFMELESMVKPIPELDYRKELEEAQDEKYGYPD